MSQHSPDGTYLCHEVRKSFDICGRQCQPRADGDRLGAILEPLRPTAVLQDTATSRRIDVFSTSGVREIEFPSRSDVPHQNRLLRATVETTVLYDPGVKDDLT